MGFAVDESHQIIIGSWRSISCLFCACLLRRFTSLSYLISPSSSSLRMRRPHTALLIDCLLAAKNLLSLSIILTTYEVLESFYSLFFMIVWNLFIRLGRSRSRNISAPNDCLFHLPTIRVVVAVVVVVCEESVADTTVESFGGGDLVPTTTRLDSFEFRVPINRLKTTPTTLSPRHPDN